MADPRSSRRPDAFSGPTKHSASNYADIFGGIGSSCSIPFLDLPPQSNVCDEPVDYEEIFGGFRGFDFAVDYEELFGKKQKKEKAPNGRIPKKTEFVKQAKDTSEVQGVFVENTSFPEITEHSDDGSSLFSMSFHKINRGSIDNTLSGTTHVTQLHAVPGYASMINSCSPIRGTKTDGIYKVVQNDHIQTVGSGRGLPDKERASTIPPSFPADCAKSSQADFKTQHKSFPKKCPAPEDGPANLMHNSHSSVNHSSPGRDAKSSEVPYVTISDISLRTEPSRVPPPSRAPPKLLSKQGRPDMRTYGGFGSDSEEGSSLKTTGNRQTHYSLGVSKSHLVNEGMKDGSPRFFDVEVDASSAAAAAAMKDAMEQAQARLRTAKELMERKRNNIQNRKKTGEQEAMKHNEKDEKPLLEVDESVKTVKENVLRKLKTVPNKEKETCVVASSGVDGETARGNGSKTPSVPYKLEEITGEWKMDREYYELVKSENSNIVKEVYKQGAPEQYQKIATKANEYQENLARREGIYSGSKMNVESQEIEEASDKTENDEKFSNMEFCEKIGVIPITKVKASTGIENVDKLHEAHDSLQQGGTEKLEAVQHAHASENELEGLKPIEGSAQGNHTSMENKKSGIRASEADIQDKNDIEAVVDQLEAVEKSNQCQSHPVEKLQSDSDHTCEENIFKFDDTTSSLEDQSQRWSRTAEAGICLKQVVEDTNRYEIDPVKPEATPGLTGDGKYDKSTKSAKEIGLQDSEVIKRRETQKEAHYNDKQQTKSTISQAVLEQENCEDATISEEGTTERGQDKVGEGDVLLKETLKNSDAAQNVCQKAADKDPELIPQTGHLEKKVNVQNLVQDDVKSPRVISQSSAEENIGPHQVNTRSSAGDGGQSHRVVSTENDIYIHKEEKRESIRRPEKEKEREKEQARNFEEEREREREKDRQAVETATREAHERALIEARERAKRIAVEKTAAEARKRASAEASEKAEKASAEALEKLAAEKALKEAKIKAERAAVERATAEARERAVKALADKAASDARQRAGRLLNAHSREVRTSVQDNKETKRQFNFPDVQTVPRDARYQSTSSSNSMKSTDSYVRGEGDSPLRCKARLERHQRTVERAAKALAEKNLRDVLAQREQAERNRLADSLDAEVRRWSTGKEGNLRALLSTLQYILGPDSGWHPIPLTEVITAVAVKKAYRKATLCVHPDKLQQRGASIQQKYICEKVFDLLKDAWNRFNSEER